MSALEFSQELVTLRGRGFDIWVHKVLLQRFGTRSRLVLILIGSTYQG